MSLNNERRGNSSLPLGKQREIRLGNDEDVIVIETDGELTSPDDDLPDISLHKFESSKRANSTTHKTGRPVKSNVVANKTTPVSCKGAPSFARQPVQKSRHTKSGVFPNSKSDASEKTPKIHQKPGGRRQVQSALRCAHSSSYQDMLVTSKSKSLPNTPASSKQHCNRASPLVECESKAPRVSKARESHNTLSSVTPEQQQTRISLDCVDLFTQPPQTAPGELGIHERGNSMHSMNGREKARPSAVKKRRVVTPECMDHSGTDKKGLPREKVVVTVEGKNPKCDHVDIRSSVSDGEVSCVRNGSKKVRQKYSHSNVLPTTSDSRIAPEKTADDDSAVVAPGHVGPKNTESSKMHPFPSTSNPHSVALKHAPKAPVRSKHPLKPPPKHLLLSPPVKSKHPLSPSVVTSSPHSTLSNPSSPLPVSHTSSKHSENHSISNSNVSKRTVTASMSKDSETESSSMFDFNENDLFEVLDSVESESICSAYNQSDSESMDTAGEGKPTSEPQSSNLAKAATCKSPSESRVKDFCMSFMKKKRMKQVARKSTTLNGAKYFKHPLNGRSYIQLKRRFSLVMSRIHYTTVQRAREEMARQAEEQEKASSAEGCSVQTAVETTPTLPQRTSTSARPFGKKRENKWQESSTATKRLKLSSDTSASNMTKQTPPTKPPVATTKSTACGSSTSTAVLTNASRQVAHCVQSPETSNQEAQPNQVAAKSQQKEGAALQGACMQTEQVLPSQDGQPKRQSEVSSPQKKRSNVPPPPSMVPQTRKPLPLILKGSRVRSEYCKHTFPPSGLSGSREYGEEKSKEHLAKSISTMPVENVQSNVSSPIRSHSSQSNSTKGADDPPETPSEIPLSSSVTPEKRVTPTEPRTPTVKKCLSLKRHHSRWTPSVSEEQAERLPVCQSPQPHTLGGATAVEVVEKVGDNTTSTEDPKNTCKMPQSPENQPLDRVTTTQPVTKERLMNTSVRGTDGPSSTNKTPQQVQAREPECRERSLSSCSETSSAKPSPRDEVYDLRLLETIAKLAPGPHMDALALSSRLAMVDEEEFCGKPKVDSQSEGIESVPLIVKLPLSLLSRVPSAVTTRALGMFRDKSVQVETGMTFDKDALDAYLVIKLHEAMFEMKAQLQMMEAQVASIAKQKESLERTLQAKTKYIRDMTTTGFKPAMVDKCVATDPIVHFSPNEGAGTSTAATQTKRPSTPNRRKSVKTAEKGEQTQVRACVSVSSQTEGVVRTVPARLQMSSRVMCLYKHPDSQLQIFIDQNRQNVASSTDDQCNEDGENPLDVNSKHNWLSASVMGECARSVAINPCVRFVKAVHDSTTGSERFGCAVHSSRPVGGSQSGDTPPELDTAQGLSNTAVPVGRPDAKCTCTSETRKVEWRDECISPPLQGCCSKLIELYFKLKALPMEPVQENHMTSLLRALHHLLSHLPVDMSPPPTLRSPSAATPNISPPPAGIAPPTSPAVTMPSTTPATPPSVSAMTPTTPPSAPPLSSPPSTPGAASWSMGAKLQELVDVLRDLEEKGREVFPKYFKAELAQLQLKVCETLTFLTVGLQHETFTHDRSGCIVDSDLQPRPWRNRDLQINPYFRRLCLDIGVRTLMQEMKRLIQQKRMGKRSSHSTSDEDSDVESLIGTAPKRVAQPRASAGSRVRRTNTTKGKGVNRKSKSPNSKSEVIRAVVNKKSARGEIRHFRIPSSSGAKSSSPTGPGTVFSPTGLTLTNTSPFTSPGAATNRVSSSSPISTTPLASPPYSKRVNRGDSFHVRVGDLLSMGPAVLVATVSGETSTAVVNTTVNTGTTLVKTDTPVVNTSTAVVNTTVATTTAAAVVNTAAVTTSVAAVKTNTTQLSSYSSTANNTGTAVSTTKASPAPPVIGSQSRVPGSEGGRVCYESLSYTSDQRSMLDSLVRLSQSVNLQSNEKLTIQKLIETAFQLTASPFAVDLQMSQLLINQIRYQLHKAMMKPLPAWSPDHRGSMNVLVQRFLPAAMPSSSSFPFPVKPPSVPTSMGVPVSIPMVGIMSLPMFTAPLPISVTTQAPSLAWATAQRSAACTISSVGCVTTHVSSIPCITSPSASATSVTASIAHSMADSCARTSAASVQASKASISKTQGSSAGTSSSTTTQSYTTSLAKTQSSTIPHSLHMTSSTAVSHSQAAMLSSSKVDEMDPVAIHHVLNPAKQVPVTTTTCGQSVPLCTTTVTTSAIQEPLTNNGTAMNIVPNSTTLSTKVTTNDQQEPIIATGTTAKSTPTTTAIQMSLGSLETFLAAEEIETKKQSSESLPPSISPESTQLCISTSHSHSGGCGKGISPVATPLALTMHCDKVSFTSTYTTPSTMETKTVSLTHTATCASTSVAMAARMAVSGSTTSGVCNISTAHTSSASTSSASPSASQSVPVSSDRMSMATSTPSTVSSLLNEHFSSAPMPITTATIRSVCDTSTTYPSTSTPSAPMSVHVSTTNAMVDNIAASTNTPAAGPTTNPASRPTTNTPAPRPTVSTPASIPTANTPGPRPTVSTPASIPTANTPGPRPTVSTPASIPTANTPGPRPTVSTPASIPTANTPGPRPTVSTPASIPTANTPGPRPDAGIPVFRPTANTPVSRPTIKTPAPRPAANTPTSRSTANTPTLRSTANTPTSRSTANTPVLRSTASTLVSRPPANTPTSRSAANTPLLRSAANTPTSRSTANIPVSRPTANTPVSRSTANTPPSRPAAKTPVSRPAANTPPSRPTAKTPVSRPAANTPPSRPTANTPVSRSTANTPPSRPAAKTPVSRPAANTPPSRPTANTPVSRSTANTPPSRPAAKPPVSRPTANTPPSRSTANTPLRSTTNTPVSRPTANTPVLRLTAPVSRSAANTPVSRPAANTPVSRPAAKTPVSRPAANTPVSRPAANTPVSRPAANTPVSRPAAKTPVSRPTAKTPVSRPPANTPVSRPPANTPVSRPTANTPVSRPTANTPPSRSTANTPPLRSTTNTPVSRPAANTPVSRPAANTPVSRPAANTPVSRPAANTPVSRPTANTPTFRPTANTSVPRPAANTPASRPAANTSLLRPPANTPAPRSIVSGPCGRVATTAQHCTSSKSTSGSSSALRVTAPHHTIMSRSATSITSAQFTVIHHTNTPSSTASSVTAAHIPTTLSTADPTHSLSTCNVSVSSAVTCSLPLMSRTLSNPISVHSTTGDYPTAANGASCNNVSTTALRSSSCVYTPPALPRLPVGQSSYPLPQLIHPPTHVHISPSSSHVPLRQLIQHGSPPTVIVQASKVANGLLIKWTFALDNLVWQTSVQSYELYAFVCNKGAKVPDISLWGKVGEIKPLALPMAVTLTNFAVGQCYSFAVRVNYVGGMNSCYSEPCTIDL